MKIELQDIAGQEMDASCPFTGLTIEVGSGGAIKVIFSNNGKPMFSMNSKSLGPGDTFNIHNIRGTIDVKIAIP
jgi:hypothetical protein